eukprot:scaffold4847_cov89-Cylindrotheca_fusiformis.AAC.6
MLVGDLTCEHQAMLQVKGKCRFQEWTSGINLRSQFHKLLIGVFTDGIAKPGSFTGRQARIRLRSGLPALLLSTWLSYGQA